MRYAKRTAVYIIALSMLLQAVWPVRSYVLTEVGEITLEDAGNDAETKSIRGHALSDFIADEVDDGYECMDGEIKGLRTFR